MLIIEVLSPSTERYDRDEKFAHYRRIPSLASYVLISQEERRLEVFSKRGAVACHVYCGELCLG